VIASYLEPHHVDRIRAVSPRLEVVYEPHLLPRPRYAADHVGHTFERPEEDERCWVSLLAEAEVLFDFDRTHLADLPERSVGATDIGERIESRGELADAPTAVASGRAETDVFPFDHDDVQARIEHRQVVGGPQTGVSGAHDGDVDLVIRAEPRSRLERIGDSGVPK